MRQSAIVVCTLAAAIGGARTMSGQTLAGRVTRDHVPVSGALVTLIDTTGKTVVRAASREGGEFSLTARGPGTYRVQVLQIGWRPATNGPYVLRTGATTRATIDASSDRILLEPIIVSDRSECRVQPDSAAAAFVLWDEARKALLSAAMTRGEPLTMTVSRTVQDLDRSGERVLADSTTTQVGSSLRPFASLPPDSLARHGYATRAADGATIYWGPDAEVLLAESFATSHCLKLERSADQRPDSARLVGVAFAPVRQRRDVVDVAGVVWLDRTSGELRAIDYHYVNTSPVIERANPGGRVEFLRIPGGRWIVDRWTIRVPATTTRVQRGNGAVVPGQARTETRAEELAGIRRTSGQVSEIRRGADVVWERGRVTLVVRVVDSASAQPVRGVLVRAAQSTSATATDSAGTVLLERVTPGALTVRLESASLATVGRSPLLLPIEVPAVNDAVISIPIPSERALVAARCGTRALEWGEGLLRVGVAGSVDAALPRAPVVITWRTSYRRLGGGEPVVAEERREVTPGSDGGVELCGVPRDATISVQHGTAAAVTTGQFAPGAVVALVTISK